MPAFIRLLSQPIPLEEVSRRLGVEYGAASNWLMRFRELIAQHDPEGIWLTRVRLGVKFRPVPVRSAATQECCSTVATILTTSAGRCARSVARTGPSMRQDPRCDRTGRGSGSPHC
ncbi:DUF746 domain-containing protein [Paraburkholderia sp. JPY419]|uniref:DUF746 domain-containing protein n=1 Tax=Paraburkholderia sp. JPY419 TaxID=667660 RepID=UPI003D22666F